MNGGGVSLRISSKIYPRSLFSLTQNVIVYSKKGKGVNG
ncbi:hypothetical protein T06_16854 [Trichinella sp. T6]|nr:hypothetical protein T06_16854 [Trichinella sp. T6]